jgi:type II secretory pathway component PulF
MKHIEILIKAREQLKKKMEGKGSLQYLPFWPGWITFSVYCVMIFFFLWLIPNAFFNLINSNTNINIHLNHSGFSFSSLYFSHHSLTWFMIMCFLVIVILFYLYKKFKTIALGHSSILKLKELHKGNDVIQSTIERWLKEKAFINYEDKKLIENYALIDNKIKLYYANEEQNFRE